MAEHHVGKRLACQDAVTLPAAAAAPGSEPRRGAVKACRRTALGAVRTFDSSVAVACVPGGMLSTKVQHKSQVGEATR